ncbi:MAG: hypothetical protein II073_01075 [Lachnospiraceae bacterium]|nr:hypothetical protein [Lachnospiraceae bacterium]
MSNERTLLVGVDLCEDVSQLTCFNPVTLEPENIGFNGDVDQCMIPTVLFYRRDTAEWTFGEEAFIWNKEKDGVLIKNLLQKASTEKLISIDGKDYEPQFLLERYLKRVLGLLKTIYPEATIRELVVTVREKNMILIQHLYQALQNLGISKLRASIQSHEQCFVTYAMNQPKELRVNDVALFDYDIDGLKYYQISVNRRTSPQTVVLNKRDFSDVLPFVPKGAEEAEDLPYMFESVLENALHKQIISTIYVTGPGFQGDWYKNALKKLCVGRRVFAGQNLYAKGAGYAAREAIGEGKLQSYLYLGDEMLPIEISMELFHQGEFHEYVLVEAGTAWYNATKTISFIPDDELEVEIQVKHVIGSQVERHFLTMDGLWNYKRKTRVELTVEFMDVHTCIVRLNDRGFGDLFPSSNRVWEKEIQIQARTMKKEET